MENEEKIRTLMTEKHEEERMKVPPNLLFLFLFYVLFLHLKSTQDEFLAFVTIMATSYFS